ncbi:hypothetical protein Pmar_PMAR004934, partial [Perkinsus marinus ATCC 50983]
MKWQAEQLFDALGQRYDEPVQAFVKRYDQAASDLEAQMGEPVPDSRKLTGLIRGLSGDAKQRALDHVSTARSSVTYHHLVQHLSHRARLESAMSSAKPKTTPATKQPSLGARADQGSPVIKATGDLSTAKNPKELCKFYYKNGKCKFGKACRFRHERPKQAVASMVLPAKEQRPETEESLGTEDDEGDIYEQQLYLVQEDKKRVGPTVFLQLGGKSPPLECLLDTGAYYNYIPISLVRKLGLPILPLDEEMVSYVLLADQRRSALEGQVRVGSMTFRVLQSSAAQAIVGVVSMCDAGIGLSFKADQLRGRLVGVTVTKPHEDFPVMLPEGKSPDRIQYDLVETEVGGPERVTDDDHILYLWSPPAEYLKAAESKPLEEHLLSDWTPVKGAAADFQWRCRRITEADIRDRPEQEFVYEVRWSTPPPSKERQQQADYSHALYSKLSNDQKHCFDEE